MNDLISGKIDANFAQQLKRMEEDLRSLRIMHYPSITISREYGCEGYPLAQRLAEKLETDQHRWSVYGRDAIQELSQSDELTAQLWESIPSETRTTFAQYLDAALAHKPTDYMLFKRMAKSLKLITLKGFSIVVGAAGAVLTQGQKHTYHFRLIAEDDFKLNRILEMDYSLAEAKNILTERENNRVRFVREFTGKDIRDPKLYSAVLNNSLLSVDEMADIIIGIVHPKIT
ncbi:cytidylate kinase-like family protein [bacterium]|nr:MAG: cytidylate kinase-like family protein [bacterium]